jgi:chitinase
MYNSALRQIPSYLPTPARRAPSRVASLFSVGLKLSVYGLFLLVLSSRAFAAPVTLVWDAVAASYLAGYVLYYGYGSGSYTMSVDVGNYTSASLTSLDEGKTYYFVAAAYDVDGSESSFSNEVSYTVPVADVPPPMDVTAPMVAITSPADGASVQKKSTVTIGADASDDVGVTKVEFYVNGQLVCADTTNSYTCAWKLPGAPGRTYQLQAKAYDAQGNSGSSGFVTVMSQ